MYRKEAIDMDMAERLQELRRKANYSQEQIADMLGISRQAISKWESGQGKPEIDNIIKLTDIYDVSSDYILLGKEDKKAIAEPAETENSKTKKTAHSIILILAAAAIITVLFIAALGFLAKYWL